MITLFSESHLLQKYIHYNKVSKIPILSPPFGLPKSDLIKEVVLISNIIS